MLILLFPACFTADCQQLYFDNYSKNEGLVNNEVHAIGQGANGYMYFGTPAGLSVYDGASFTNYSAVNGFVHNIISGIHELAKDSITLFTGGHQYYGLAGKKLVIDSFGGQIAVKNVYAAGNGQWYACTYNGLYLYTKHHLLKIPIDGGHSFQGINCVLPWQDSLLLVGRSYEPADIYNCRTWKRVASSAERIFVRDICTDAAGNAWLATIGNGVLLLKNKPVQDHQIRFEKLPVFFEAFRQTEFRAITRDKKNNLWMASINQGLIEYEPATGRGMQVTMEQGLLSNTLFSLYNDRENNLWIGSNRGLQKLPANYTTAYTARQGLPADLVLDVLSLPGNRFLSCGYYGVGYLAGAGQKIKAWVPPLDDEHFVKFMVVDHRYYALSIRKLVELSVTPQGVTAKRCYPLPEHVRDMQVYENNKLLLAGDSSLFLFFNGSLKTLSTGKIAHVTCMTTDSAGIVWMANLNNTVNGYRVANGTATLVYSFVYKGRSPQDLIQCMMAAGNNCLLCGTAQSGICVAVRENNQFRQQLALGIAAGLGSNDVQSLFRYNDSTVLAGTGNGLDQIISSGQPGNFSVHNINNFYHFSNTVYCIEKNIAGGLLLGTEAGLLQVPGIETLHIGTDPPIVISAVQLPDRPDSLVSTDQVLELPYKNNGITISYASPSFTDEKGTRYACMLEGSNQQGNTTLSASSHVTFPNLSPGRYRFVVKAVNRSGAFSTKEASIAIIIHAPIWQQWWFIGLALLAIAAATGLVIKRRITVIRREAQLKSKITETEMIALRAQMNPHFIFNCMSIIDALVAANRNEEALDFLQKFSKLIRMVLENSQYQQVPLQQDLQALQLYTQLESVRNNHRFSCSFEVDDTLVENDYKIPPLLLQPYVENAIVHGLRNKEEAGGKLLVAVKKQGNHIIAIIEDNGIGRKAAIQLNAENRKPYQQLGMQVTGKRIALLRALNSNKVEIHIEDAGEGIEPGTRVTILLPHHLKFE